MEAAEGVFGGEFDHVTGMDEDVQMAGPSGTSSLKSPAKMTVWFHLRRPRDPGKTQVSFL